MINLIGNELTKVFKKKTIYILIFITIGYIILSNFMMKITNDSSFNYYFYSEGDLEYYEERLSTLDPNNISESSDYFEYKKDIELINLAKPYGNNSWQTYVIYTKLTGYIDTMIEYEYSDEITEEAYNEAKAEYDEAVKRLEENDWRYFVNQDLEYINSSLETQYKLRDSTDNQTIKNSINETIKGLELEKQINDWRLEKNIDYGPTFLNSAIENYYMSKQSLLNYDNTNIEELDYEELQAYRDMLQTANLNQYYIENSITLDSLSRSIFINLFGNYELFILIIAIVIAGSIVSEEFNRGTIKLLLVKPYKRVKILLAKFIVCMIILLLAIGIVYFSQLLFGGIINGFDGLTTPAIVYNFDTNQVQTINIFAYVLLTGFCKLPMYILLTTLAFACSTIFNSTALAVAVPFLGYIGSTLINQFAIIYNFNPIIYFVTPNWDLSYYLYGGLPLFEGLTAPFSIIICVIYLVIMLVLSSIVFKKRDIKNI